MRYLYSESGLNTIKKKKNSFYLFFALDSVLEIAVVLLCLLLSSYHTRLVFSIVGSILSIFVFFYLIFLIDHFRKIDHLVREYEALLNGEETIIKGTVVEIPTHLITLPDGTKAYKVIVKNDKESRVLLLSDLFDINILENKEYKFSTYYDYIRGFEDEL